MNTNLVDPRGTIMQSGNIMHVDNAFVEEVSITNCSRGYLLVSYAVPGPNGIISIELLRLNVNKNTIIMNAFGTHIHLCDIHEGMWIDSLFSSAMTRSIPPQSSAFLIIARRQTQPSASVTTDRVAMVDVNNGFLYTGNPHIINTQMRFVISDTTVILDRNGNLIPLRAIRPGQMVRVIHANFQTASIPPQTTAFYVQQL